MNLRWKIYYGDGSSWNNSKNPFDAPGMNVQMIAVADPDHGWYLCRSNDYYWYLPNTDNWQGGDMFGLFDYLLQPGQKKVIFGRTISNEDFIKTLNLAYNDPEIPQKTGWQPRERESGGIT